MRETLASEATEQKLLRRGLLDGQLDNLLVFGLRAIHHLRVTIKIDVCSFPLSLCRGIWLQGNLHATHTNPALHARPADKLCSLVGCQARTFLDFDSGRRVLPFLAILVSNLGPPLGFCALLQLLVFVLSCFQDFVLLRSVSMNRQLETPN